MLVLAVTKTPHDLVYPCMHLAKDQWLGQLFDDAGRRFLHYLAARLKDGTDADDLAQEVYLRLLRADEALVIRDPRSFAIRVASNVACEWGRLARHQRPHLDEQVLGDQVSTSLDPAEQAAFDQQMEILAHALNALTPMRRAVVLLRLRDGLSYAEIAAQVGLSVSMVYKHLSLGLVVCQQRLHADGPPRETP